MRSASVLCACRLLNTLARGMSQCFLVSENTVQPTYLHRCRSDKLYAIIRSMLINGNMQLSKLVGLS